LCAPRPDDRRKAIEPFHPISPDGLDHAFALGAHLLKGAIGPLVAYPCLKIMVEGQNGALRVKNRNHRIRWEIGPVGSLVEFIEIPARG
jgi:hypothetical protein